MIRLLVDEDFNNDILRGLRRRVPDIDAQRVQAIGLGGADDRVVLAHAAAEDRVVLTHDVSTMVGYAYQRIRTGDRMPGIIVVAQSMLARAAIEDLVIVLGCSTAEDWRDQVSFLPLR
jgi:predicted nuclease of predicted toxin-antitoxin system